MKPDKITVRIEADTRRFLEQLADVQRIYLGYVRSALKRHGIPETSAKRTEAFGRPTSDHRPRLYVDRDPR